VTLSQKSGKKRKEEKGRGEEGREKKKSPYHKKLREVGRWMRKERRMTQVENNAKMILHYSCLIWKSNAQE
jgi:hypothetical protein